ncbi:glycosyltransferase family 2 protein [Planococcus sp. CAU13]|uniref:glycosyltransferase family 2 protein n=1 Tax=Planococcus sp. CAU13 TaxID=1541197 RepID=UPI00068CC7FC|nr:glycosyltransferase family 2 protein [Planococcus sp. CAU13]
MNETIDITLVAIAYNRPDSLSRLLASLNKAWYPERNVKLIISIDHGGPSRVIDVAENFEWKFGTKQVIVHEQNLGLRKHILQCGDLTKIYENIIVLEDDIFVSKLFYKYALSALAFYDGAERISGISLYSHKFNETAKLPFTPLKEEQDVYFLQIAASSGQVWTARTWKDFKKWYDEGTKDENWHKMPDNIAGWPETSWKKYYTKFLMEKNKFFVYPYESLTTNFGDIGQHFWKTNSSAQVPLNRNQKQFNFCAMENSTAVYDVFCENRELASYISSYAGDSCTVDLYGTKKDVESNRFLLTVKPYPYMEVKKFALALKPMEENIFHEIAGEQIFLYDTYRPFDVKPQSKDFIHRQYEYYYPGLDIRKAFKLLFNRFTFSVLYQFVKAKAVKTFRLK